jgi:hypothetical protein
MKVKEPSFIEILNKRGWLYRRLRKHEDICFTRRMKEKMFFESEVKEAMTEWLKGEREYLVWISSNPVYAATIIDDLIDSLNEKNATPCQRSSATEPLVISSASTVKRTPVQFIVKEESEK